MKKNRGIKSIHMRIPLFYVLASVLLFSSCLQDKNVDWYKYKEITNIKELQNYYPSLILDTSGHSESAVISEYLDLSCTLEYTYDNSDTSTSALFYKIEIETNISESEARKTFMLKKATYEGVSSFGELKHVEMKIDLPGDDNYYVIRKFENEPNGLIYLTRRGSVVYSLITSGIYSPDHSIMKKLVLPDIENLKDFKIKKRFFD